jgi:antitoxin component YwqK of YwqJK toxin-antitoxin module
MKEKYQISDNKLEIIDLELKINLTSELPIEKKIEYYENKKIFSVMHFNKGLLHGPSFFYSKEGILLAASWFFNGKRVGKSYHYYNSSKLYSLNRYIDDQFEGEQLYYYEDGSIKTIMNYKDGKLNGDTKLFYENKKLKRHLIFENDQKTFDNIFDENGKIIDEKSFSL